MTDCPKHEEECAQPFPQAIYQTHLKQAKQGRRPMMNLPWVIYLYCRSGAVANRDLKVCLYKAKHLWLLRDVLKIFMKEIIAYTQFYAVLS